MLLFEEPDTFTPNELNSLTKEKNYSCLIREALINWSDMNNFPDQQIICNEGEKIISSLGA